ncbi:MULTISPECIES: hypothetical protein [Paraliobacillus]|uniref:hypothetical protein n=1 Tax=Paraliobacillus TaxID=200903 RepID=UPI000E3E5D74|nr:MULTISPECIES: hypothetical protein [Paraliobacillus]
MKENIEQNCGLLEVTGIIGLADYYPDEIFSYLKQEFMDLYEYQNNGENLDKFLLNSYSSMVVLKTKEEFCRFMYLEEHIEFIEEEKIGGFTVIRLRVYQLEEVQSMYYTKII